MGGAVSSGEDNTDLVDKLMEGDYIKDPVVEKVFRAVDRGDYFLPDQRMHAYKDQAWKHGNIHLSAPCIYAEVMEWLKLGPGMSFLNLGSGTGYLSTMAGLILGPYGVNHGVEYYQDVINYAEQKLESFIRTNEAFDEFEFCEPTYVRGNCLLLSPSTRLYDRLYCGASCPSENETYIKKLIKIGGILVMPLNDQLVQVTRVSETQWDTKMILPVSFARLIPTHSTLTEAEYVAEDDGNGEGERVRLRWKSETSPPPTDLIELPNPKIMTLQEISRLAIRRILLQNIRSEHPNMSRKRSRKSKKQRQPPAKQRRVNLIPTETGLMFVGQLSDDSDREPERPGRRWRSRGRSVRENPWRSRLEHAIVTRFFNPYHVFLPGEERDRMDTESRMEAGANVGDAENGVAEDASLREMQDEPMPNANPESSDSSESSGDEDNFLEAEDKFRLRAALNEVTLRVNNNVIAGYEGGNINDTTLREESIAVPTVSVATNSMATVSAIITSVATTCTASAQFARSTATVDTAFTSTATVGMATTTAAATETTSTATASMATAGMTTTSMATADTATTSMATADMATRSLAAVLTAIDSISSAASCSSGVETCSSIDADSVDAVSVASIFWTQEFQADEAETEHGVPSGKGSEACNPKSCNDETSASHDHPSSTQQVDCADEHNAENFFRMMCSSHDSTEKTTGNNAEEEEAMEAEISEARTTYQTHLQKKVDLLPIPQPMKNFLLFYRN